nr:probable protein phosphatase 2C 12 [Tanacetum cinerariifolium]
ARVSGLSWGRWGRACRIRGKWWSGAEMGGVIGPLRCWLGGLFLSWSIGDLDVGEFIVPVPYVKQVKLSFAVEKMIIATDGV